MIFYIIIGLLAICWIWILIDLKKTPLQVYDIKEDLIPRTDPMIKIEIKELKPAQDCFKNQFVTEF